MTKNRQMSHIREENWGQPFEHLLCPLAAAADGLPLGSISAIVKERYRRLPAGSRRGRCEDEDNRK